MPAIARSSQMQYPRLAAPRGQHRGQVLVSWGERLVVTVSEMISQSLGCVTAGLGKMPDALTTPLEEAAVWTLTKAKSEQMQTPISAAPKGQQRAHSLLARDF